MREMARRVSKHPFRVSTKNEKDYKNGLLKNVSPSTKSKSKIFERDELDYLLCCKFKYFGKGFDLYGIKMSVFIL